MSVAQAAQAVQRSAFPDAYAKWEPAARAIVERLAGITDPAAASAGPGCTSGSTPNGLGACPATGLPVENGLTADALLVLRCGKKQFPQLTTFYGVGNRPANTDDDHQTGRAGRTCTTRSVSMAAPPRPGQIPRADHHPRDCRWQQPDRRNPQLEIDACTQGPGHPPGAPGRNLSLQRPPRPRHPRRSYPPRRVSSTVIDQPRRHCNSGAAADAVIRPELFSALSDQSEPTKHEQPEAR